MLIVMIGWIYFRVESVSENRDDLAWGDRANYGRSLIDEKGYKRWTWLRRDRQRDRYNELYRHDHWIDWFALDVEAGSGASDRRCRNSECQRAEQVLKDFD